MGPGAVNVHAPMDGRGTIRRGHEHFSAVWTGLTSE